MRYFFRFWVLILLGLTASVATFSQEETAPQPQQIVVGAYINDIQDVDLKTHSFLGDIYIWFRWTNPEFDPTSTFEFMNLHDPEASVTDVLYDAPKVMPDGSFYNIIRHQGGFSSKMPLDNYPFDHQELAFVIEDSEYGARDVIFVADDQAAPSTRNKYISLPGYIVGDAEIRVTTKVYPMNFGDLTAADNEPYSRVAFIVPIERPKKSGIVKGLLPVLIVLICAALALLIHPRYTEGRIGLTITALLTLVALQLTASGELPEVGYLMVIDQIYLLSYAFIMLVLAEVVENTWRRKEAEGDYSAAIRRDRIVLVIVSVAYVLGIALILRAALS